MLRRRKSLTSLAKNPIQGPHATTIMMNIDNKCVLFYVVECISKQATLLKATGLASRLRHSSDRAHG